MAQIKSLFHKCTIHNNFKSLLGKEISKLPLRLRRFISPEVLGEKYKNDKVLTKFSAMIFIVSSIIQRGLFLSSFVQATDVTIISIYTLRLAYNASSK